MSSSNQNMQGIWLIFGSTGWIGSKIVHMLTKLMNDGINDPKFTCCVDKSQWPSSLPISKVIGSKSRLENRSDVAAELDEIKPNFVVNCAGLIGKPNVDWCEDNKFDVIRVNVVGALTLFDLCNSRKIHVTNFGTGCIYYYDNKHQVNSGLGFTENDKPNFDGSFYSHTKSILDNLIRNYDNVLNLRLRMPISDDRSKRSLITKITNYEKVIDIPNSMTVLYDLLPVAINMTMRNLTGVYNFVNPGTISHNQILDLYIKSIDPEFTYVNFTVEEQDKILKAARSNNHLDATKLCKEYPLIPTALKSVENVLQRMKEHMI